MTWTASDIPAQTGRTAIITGVGGIGFETGLALARAGGDIILAGRNVAKGRASADRIRAAVPHAAIRFELLDLASLASVEDFAARMLSARQPLHLLVNNAGVMAPPIRRETTDGHELQFGTNHLGHFALTVRLLPLLLIAQSARVVSVSSVAHRRGSIDFEDLQALRKYNPSLAYAQSKLANLMFALELNRRATAAGSTLMSNGAHPGVARTELFTNGPGRKGMASLVGRMLLPLIGQSPAHGALPILFAATSPDARGGTYHGPSGFAELKGPPTEARVAPQANDEAAARRLWKVSEDLTHLKWPLAPSG